MQQPMHSAAMYRSMQISWYQQTGGAFRVLASRFGRWNGVSADSAAWCLRRLRHAGSGGGGAAEHAAGEAFQQTIADAFPVNRAALRELMQKEIEAQRD